MCNIGLLLLTGPFRLMVESISHYLKSANKNVIKRLYVKLEPELDRPFLKSDVIYLKSLSDFLPLLYNKASSLCQNLDVCVVLSNTKRDKVGFDYVPKLDVILTNYREENKCIDTYVDCYFGDTCRNIIKIQDKELLSADFADYRTSSEYQVYNTVCLGGTFDCLHNGHKVLLSEAALRATNKLIVGVTVNSMLKKKVLWELIEPVEKRITDVTTFLLDVDPSLHYEVVPITDPYGPTITNPDINCIVVSAETRIGGQKVNDERRNRGMCELSMYVVNLVENTERIPGEEEKLSSSTRRMHLLGTCLKEPKAFSNGFYSIFLQGQPMTGKSYISNSLEKHGAVVISCSDIITSLLNDDKLIKDIFTNTFNGILIKECGSLDYKKLVQFCLKNKEKRQWAASILCEKVQAVIKQKMQSRIQEGAKLIIIQDSLLLDGCLKCSDMNEQWSTVMPVTEIAKRLSSCYELSEQVATNAVLSLPSNEQYVGTSNRIFCNQWSLEITEEQISRAWSELRLKI